MNAWCHMVNKLTQFYYELNLWHLLWKALKYTFKIKAIKPEFFMCWNAHVGYLHGSLYTLHVYILKKEVLQWAGEKITSSGSTPQPWGAMTSSRGECFCYLSSFWDSWKTNQRETPQGKRTRQGWPQPLPLPPLCGLSPPGSGAAREWTLTRVSTLGKRPGHPWLHSNSQLVN